MAQSRWMDGAVGCAGPSDDREARLRGDRPPSQLLGCLGKVSVMLPPLLVLASWDEGRAGGTPLVALRMAETSHPLLPLCFS